MTLLDDVLAATDVFDPEAVLTRYPWLVERGQDCIVSPDADGQLCALCLSHLLGWRVRGFYDGKAMVVEADVDPKQCVFVDVEIYRQPVRSFGNHMVLFNANHPPDNWDQFDNCFAINNWRGHDHRVFRRKYPFATIHFLLIVLNQRLRVDLPESATGPLLFADGVYKVLLERAENAWDWIRYLEISEAASPLHDLSCGSDRSVYDVLELMIEFWRRRDELSRTGQRGDRIAITARGGDGAVINLVPHGSMSGGQWRYDPDVRDRNEQFLSMLGEMTGWPYAPSRWSWEHWRLIEFDKTIDSGVSNIPSFASIMKRRPVSLAMTVQKRCEYTLERDAEKGVFD